jgi:hypothetical protein
MSFVQFLGKITLDLLMAQMKACVHNSTSPISEAVFTKLVLICLGLKCYKLYHLIHFLGGLIGINAPIGL